MRVLTYTNPSGTTLTLSQTPYLITKLSGIDAPRLAVQEKFAPYQDGSTYIDALFQPRDIVVEGAISGSPVDLTDIATARRALVAALTPKSGIGTLTYTWDGGSFAIAAIPVSSPVLPNKLATEPFQRFQITFHCPDPYWRSVAATNLSVVYLGYSLEFPAGGIEFVPGGILLSELGGIKGQMQNITIVGDVPSPVTLVFYGPADNPKITNNTTGEYIRIEKTLATGEAITVTTDFGNKTVTIGGVNAMQYLDLSSIFFLLQPGINQLQFDEDGTNVGSSAAITYYDRYIGA